MKKIISLLVLLLSIATTEAFTMSVNQTDFYFNVGEDAVIPVIFNNTNTTDIAGLLSYTVSQQVQQAGFYYSSTNSNSETFTVPPGVSVVNLDFGTTNTPSELLVSMSFVYGKHKVALDNLRIHFNGNTTNQGSSIQINTGGNRISVSTQLNNMLNNFFGNQQQQNLMLQDSKALKQQITKELEHQKQLENSFKQNLARNEKLRELNNQLEQQGFNLTGINVFPKSNSTGNFQLSYMNRSGATAEIRGKLLNNSMKLVIDTPQIRQRMLSALYNNSQFRQISQMLASQGYKLRNLSIKLDYNNTSINLSYSNGKLNTTVSALLNNSTVKEISVKKEQARKRTIWPVIVLILTLVSSLLVLAYYLKRKNNRHTNIALVPDKKEDFDYGKEALRLLRKAKRLAESKKTKEAFAEIARSVRYYLIHKYGLNKEMTNYEITTILQDKEPQIKELIQVLNICTLVEFARFRPKRNDFSNTYQLAKKIILGK